MITIKWDLHPSLRNVPVPRKTTLRIEIGRRIGVLGEPGTKYKVACNTKRRQLCTPFFRFIFFFERLDLPDLRPVKPFF